MATKIRAELSRKNQYWIERHRYYELKHFCLQYRYWKTQYAALSGIRGQGNDICRTRENGVESDPTCDTAIRLSYYSRRFDMIERVAQATDSEIGHYILVGVTEGLPYDVLRARLNVPCCKDAYYDLYRKFFWLLDKERE